MKRLLLLSFASIFIIMSLSGVALLAACIPVTSSQTGKHCDDQPMNQSPSRQRRYPQKKLLNRQQQ